MPPRAWGLCHGALCRRLLSPLLRAAPMVSVPWRPLLAVAFHKGSGSGAGARRLRGLGPGPGARGPGPGPGALGPGHGARATNGKLCHAVSRQFVTSLRVLCE